MPSICFYFQVHQPFRIKNYSFFDIGKDHFYEDDEKNRVVLNKVSEKCYLKTNQKMLSLIRKHKGKFRISYSLSGTVIEQLEIYRPDVLQSFVDLAETGCVEFLAETYYHSLSYIYSNLYNIAVNIYTSPTLSKILAAVGTFGTIFAGFEYLFYKIPKWLFNHRKNDNTIKIKMC